MEKRRLLKETERMLEEKRAQLGSTRNAAGIWMGTLRGAYAKAKEYGLMHGTPDSADPNWEISV